MTARTGLPRRALAGVLGLAAAVPAGVAATVPPPGPDDRLWRCLRLLEEADERFGDIPDDHPAQDVAVARIDAILAEAAGIRPASAEGFAVKALIAQRWGDQSPAGEMVPRWLLCDLIERGSLS